MITQNNICSTACLAVALAKAEVRSMPDRLTPANIGWMRPLFTKKQKPAGAATRSSRKSGKTTGQTPVPPTAYLPAFAFAQRAFCAAAIAARPAALILCFLRPGLGPGFVPCAE